MIEIGAQVRYRIDNFPPGVGTIIGFMTYGPDDVVLVASEQHIGCPMNICWVEKQIGFDHEEGLRLRERYLARFPGTLTHSFEEKIK